MAGTLRILCVHGVGHAELDHGFREAWGRAIRASVDAARPGQELVVDYLEYDQLFEHAPLSPVTYGVAFTRLLASMLSLCIADGVTTRRGLDDLPALVRWTAGMVAQWSTEPRLRAALRARLESAVGRSDYDMICAHSLGSLIAYDTFARRPASIAGKTLVTFGSQVGHPAVRDIFAGRIGAIPGVRRWFHLFNPQDHVLTAPLAVPSPAFTQLDTSFDIPSDPLNHDAAWYLRHSNTVSGMWQPMLGGAARVFTTAARTPRRSGRQPDRRALIIGIDQYPDPANRLEGCLNDAFLMSSVLQECGFEAEDIRLVLDERATTQGILERMQWLLEDAEDGDERLLFYSGHGAQIPAYGPDQEPDHFSESLVPYDFDWTPAHSITDRQFSQMYSQLPYGARFVAVFDCCHSGGLTRDGGPKVRGINPPDDVRHRALRWSMKDGMWVSRKFPLINRSLSRRADGEKYVGEKGTSYRLGRAARLRGLPRRDYVQTRQALGHDGPYLPVLLEACKEAQFSYEYRHGATSYGAFSYCVAQALRTGKTLSFIQLITQVGDRLQYLGYDQTPQVFGAKEQLALPVPWNRPPLSRGRSRSTSNP